MNKTPLISSADIKKLSPEELSGIGQPFRVTNRGFSRAIESLRLGSEINDLPKDAIVTVIGSGLHNSFAKGVRENRDDVKVISLDPTLGFDSSIATEVLYDDENLNQVTYIPNHPVSAEDKLISIARGEEIRKRRVTSAKEAGNRSIAGLVPEIPLKDESVNLLIDNWGPAFYLDRYEDESPLENYLKHILRVIKLDGAAHLYPIDYVYDRADLPKSVLNENAIREYKSILEGFDGVSFEFYEEYDPKFESDRIGIIIKKTEEGQSDNLSLK